MVWVEEVEGLGEREGKEGVNTLKEVYRESLGVDAHWAIHRHD